MMRKLFVAGGLGVWLQVSGVAVAAPTPAPEAQSAPPPATVALRLGGSNTIGASLAVELVKGYFRGEGCFPLKVDHDAATDNTQISCSLSGQRIAASITAQGSVTAFQGLNNGTLDIGMASRPMTHEESAELARDSKESLPPSEMVLGLDGIAIIVHPDNRIANLSLDRIKEIFTGKVTNWAELGGASGPIHVYARDDNSGTYDIFKTQVLGNAPLSTGAQRFSDNDLLSRQIIHDPAGIGFAGLGAIGKAKALAVAAQGAMSMKPSRFTVATEDYALSRRLFLYAAPVTFNQDVVPFLQFAASAKGQAIVARAGFVPLTITQEQVAAPAAAPKGYQDLVSGGQRLSTNFRFRKGSSELDSRALADVERVASYLSSSGLLSQHLMLLGFADGGAGQSGGTDKQISEQRAKVVAEALRLRGVNADVLRGFGAELPVADNASPSGKEKNRRVEAWIHP